MPKLLSSLHDAGSEFSLLEWWCMAVMYENVKFTMKIKERREFLKKRRVFGGENREEV